MGTTQTSFPTSVYNALVNNLLQHCKATQQGMMHLQQNGCQAKYEKPSCWRLNSLDIKGREEPTGFPEIHMNFRGVEGETSVAWPAKAYLRSTSDPEVWCYNFVPGQDNRTVLGISWMLHKDIIFDLTHRRLGIARAKCPEHHRSEAKQTVITAAD